MDSAADIQRYSKQGSLKKNKMPEDPGTIAESQMCVDDRTTTTRRHSDRNKEEEGEGPRQGSL